MSNSAGCVRLNKVRGDDVGNIHSSRGLCERECGARVGYGEMQIEQMDGGGCHNLNEKWQEASEDTEESPAGCAGEGKQSKGN